MSKHKKKKQRLPVSPKNDFFSRIELISLFQKTHFYLFLIVLVTSISYGNIFRNNFVIDDTVFIKNWNLPHHVSSIGALLSGATPVGQEGVYRPIRGLLYLIYAHIWGTNAVGFHLHAFLVLLLSSFILYFIVKKLTSNTLLSGVISIFFATSPMHTEAVAYMTASMDTTGSLFLLVSFLAYLYWREAMTMWKVLLTSILCGALAFFTYEVTIVLPLLILLYEVCYYPVSITSLKKMYPYIVLFFALAGMYLYVRMGIFGIVSRGQFITGSFWPIGLATMKAMVQLSALTVLPLQLAYNHIFINDIESVLYRGYNTAPLLKQSFFDPFMMVSTAVFLTTGTVAILMNKKKPFVSFGIGWILICLVPLSNIFPQYAIMHERFFYLPSVGIFMILGYLLFSFRKPSLQVLSLSIIGILVIGYSYQTIQRNIQWHDSVSFWKHDITISPEHNAYANLQLGNWYLENRQYSLAIPYFEKAYMINPHFAVAIGSAAQLYEQLGFSEKAIQLYKKAISANTTTWEAHFYLGNLYLKQKEKELAIVEYTKTLQIQPNFQDAKAKLASLGVNSDLLLNSNIPVSSTGIDTSGWISYQNTGISFIYPPAWEASSKEQAVVLTSDDGHGTITLETNKIGVLSQEAYLSQQMTIFGTLTKQGAAMIPHFDSAYVRVWHSGSLNIMQFFLFKGDTVIEIRVSPADEKMMHYFDTIVEGIKVL